MFLVYIFVLFSTALTLNGAASSQSAFQASVVKRKAKHLERVLELYSPNVENLFLLFQDCPIELVAAALPKDNDWRNEQIRRMINVCYLSRARVSHEEERDACCEKITQLCECIKFNGWHTIPMLHIILKDRWIALASEQYIVTSAGETLRGLAAQAMFSSAERSYDDDLRHFAMAELFLQHLSEEHLLGHQPIAPGTDLLKRYLVKKIRVEAGKEQPNFAALHAVLERLSEPAFNDILTFLHTPTIKAALYKLAVAEKLPALLSSTGNSRMAVLHRVGKEFYDRIKSWIDRAGCTTDCFEQRMTADLEGRENIFFERVSVANSLREVYLELICAAGNKTLPSADGKSEVPLVFEIMRSGYLNDEISSTVLDAFENIVWRHRIKPNVPIFSDDSVAAHSFFAACIMNHMNQVNNSWLFREPKRFKNNLHDLLCSMLDADEFDAELRALQVLPAFKKCAERLNDNNLRTLASSSHERARSLAIVAGNAQRLQPTLFERLAGRLVRRSLGRGGNLHEDGLLPARHIDTPIESSSDKDAAA